tara:strand:+ start:897 stop:1664 length:768 start_codon:yes stop_codon:yes gene_type:complete
MHSLAKWTLGIGGVVVLIGFVLGAIAGSKITDLDDWAIEDSNAATVKIADEDGFGDIGYSFFVKGDYVDSDDNGVWDHCQGFELTITEKPDDAKWDDDEGGFYFQASSEGKKTCDVQDGADRDRPGFAKVGHACLGCYRGELSFEANQPVWAVNTDAVISEVVAGIGGIIGGSSCVCCGFLILIIGVLMAFLMDDDAPTSYQVDEQGRVILNQGQIFSNQEQQSSTDSENGSIGSSNSEGDSDDATELWYKQTEG